MLLQHILVLYLLLQAIKRIVFVANDNLCGCPLQMWAATCLLS